MKRYLHVNQIIDVVIVRALSEIFPEDPKPNVMAADGTLWYRLEKEKNNNSEQKKFPLKSFSVNRVDGSPLSAFFCNYLPINVEKNCRLYQSRMYSNWSWF